jgi:single-strand DNA-binding protein
MAAAGAMPQGARLKPGCAPDYRISAKSALNGLADRHMNPHMNPHESFFAKEERLMAGSVNKVILVGNLGRDPEMRRTSAGDPIVSFSVATSESWRDKASGERKERTEWHNVVIFNENLGKIAEQYCKKGSKVYLEGQLQTREYTDRDGNQRKTTEVVLPRFRGELALLDGRGRDAAAPYEPGNDSFGHIAPREEAPERRPGGSSSRTADIIDDDIPF